MVDLTVAATANAALRQRDFDVVRVEPGVEALADEVNTQGRVNVGVGQPKLRALLTNGSVPSAWERCGELARTSGRSVDEHWAEEQNYHAVRRGAFEVWMKNGRSSQYGALAINNRWVPSYGDFAIELKRPNPGHDVYLPSNSAEDYVHLDGTVRRAEVLRDVTAHDQRHLLTGLFAVQAPFRSGDRYPVSERTFQRALNQLDFQLVSIPCTGLAAVCHEIDLASKRHWNDETRSPSALATDILKHADVWIVTDYLNALVASIGSTNQALLRDATLEAFGFDAVSDENVRVLIRLLVEKTKASPRHLEVNATEVAPRFMKSHPDSEATRAVSVYRQYALAY